MAPRILAFFGVLAVLSPTRVDAARFGAIYGAIRAEARAEWSPAAVGVTVRVVGSDHIAQTDLTGRFRLEDVLIGDRRVEIRTEGRPTFVMPVVVHEGDNLLGIVTLQPEVRVQGKPGSAEWGSVGPHVLPAYEIGSDCDTTQYMFLPVDQRADSLRSWGSCSVTVRGWPPVIAFSYRPKRPLNQLAITILDAAGRPVRRVREGSAAAHGSRTWDLRDEALRVVPTGPYVVRFVAPKDSIDVPFCVHPADYHAPGTHPVE